MSHPQQPDAFAAYGNYNGGGGGMGNRSPTSTRTGYATLPSGMGVSRQAQRQQQPQQMDAMNQRVPGLYPMQDGYGILDTISRSPAVSGIPGDYMPGNQSAWNYNGNSATVSGPVPDMRGPRAANRRPGIPDVSSGQLQFQSSSTRSRSNTNPFDKQYWMPQPESSPQPSMGIQPPQQAQTVYPTQPMPTIPYGHMVSSIDQLRSQQAMFQDVRSQQDKKDDLIPTAIVIKNIPFNVRKEVLQAIMMEMGLPQPYAFNYHFDNGVFRGLAFANFSSAEETRQVIERMNQFDVHGRKLRVEYKKMLPEHERERIEREKRQKRGQLEEQHRPVPLTHQGSLQSLVAQPIEVTPSRTSPSSKYPFAYLLMVNSLTTLFVADMPDLNDGRTLDLYVQLRKYKEDPSAREYLPFESSKSPEERRLIHTLAHHLGLYHESMGSNENRCTVVWKEGMTPPSLALNSTIVEQLQYPGQNKILARAATIDFGEQRTASSNGYGTIGRNGNPSLEIPEDSPDGLNSANNLRTIRSMAELGRPGMQARTPSPGESAYANNMGMSSRQDLSSGFPGMTTTPTTPGGSSLNHRASDLSLSAVTNNLSSLSVAEGPYETSRRDPGAIGSQRPSMNGLNGRNAPERQPRGPDNGWETNGGFAIRRANGHAQRGSGSSYLTSESYSELLTGSQADSSDNYHGSGGSSSLYSH